VTTSRPRFRQAAEFVFGSENFENNFAAADRSGIFSIDIDLNVSLEGSSR